MVMKLLCETDDNDPLVYYIFGTSYPKMVARLDHQFSRGALGCLFKIRGDLRLDKTFDSVPLSQSDVHFRAVIHDLSKYAPILRDLRSLSPLQGDSATPPTPVVLTRAQFHEILCDLLDAFRKTLMDLDGAKSLRVEKRKAKMHDLIMKAATLGRALRAMVYSNAMERHMAAIAQFLTYPLWDITPKVARRKGGGESADAESSSSPGEQSGGRDSAPPNTEANPADNDEGLDEQSEYEGIPLPLPTGSLPTHFSHVYMDWLRLMVAYVEAPSVIRSYLEKHDHPIGYTVLSLEHAGFEMTPWKDLLREHQYPVNKFEAALKTFLADEPTLLLTKMFHDAGAVLKTNRFAGTVHCEASLATLMYLSVAEPGQLTSLGQMFVPALKVSFLSLDPAATY